MTTNEILQNPGLFLNKYNQAMTRISELNTRVQKKDDIIHELRKKNNELRMNQKPKKRVIVPSKIEQHIDHIHSILYPIYNVPLPVIKSSLRKREVTEARHILIYFLHKHYEVTLIETGKAIGGRHYSTVIHACQLVEDLCIVDKRFSQRIEQIKSELA